MATIDRFETWLVLIKRSFQGLSGAINTVGIVKELIEILPNEVCDNNQGRRRMGSGENTEQTAGKGQEQILSIMKRVYSRI